MCSIGEKNFLVVEWPTSERADFEAAILKRKLVAVHVDNCQIRRLPYCEIPGEYAYQGLTRKNDQVKIRSVAELHAEFPFGAARLEAKLQRGGTLDVEIALVGIYSAQGGRPTGNTLSRECETATHAITEAQVGAFQFYAEGSGEIRAGGGVGQVGAGVGSSAIREVLTEDGNPANCDTATRGDQQPPMNCGALIRVRLEALGAAWSRPTPTVRPQRSRAPEPDRATSYDQTYRQALARYHNLEGDSALQEIDSVLRGASALDPATARLRALRAVIIFGNTGRALDATAAFMDAVQADRAVTLPPDLNSPDLQKLLNQAREPPDPNSLSPESRLAWAKMLFKRGNAAHERGDFSSSTMLFEQAFAYAPESYLFAFNIGQDAWELRDCARVKRYLNQFLRAEKASAELRQKAEALLRQAEGNPECVTDASMVPR